MNQTANTGERGSISGAALLTLLTLMGISILALFGQALLAIAFALFASVGVSTAATDRNGAARWGR